MTEVKPEEKSDDSADTDDEQKTEESEPVEKSAKDNKAPVIETADDSEVKDDTDSDDGEKEPAEAGTFGFNSIEAVEPVSINVVQCEKSDNADGFVELDEDAVAIHYIEGVDGGQAVGGDTPVKFRVEALDGWKEDANNDIKVAWGIDKEGQDLVVTDKTSAAVSGVYTIPTNGTTGTGKDTKKIYTGEITIRVIAERIQPKLVAAAANTVWLNDEEKTSITTSGVAKEFSLFQDEISVLVDAKAVDDVKVVINNGSADIGTAVACERTDETAALTDAADATKYPVYTFDPTALAGYEENTRNSALSFVITKTSNAEKTLTINIDGNKGAAYTVEAVGYAELKDTDDTHYIKFTAQDAIPTFSPALDKTNYAKTSDKDNVLAFEVEAGTNRTVTGVKAVLTKANDSAFSKDIEVASDTYTTGTAPDEVEHTYYMLPLSGIEEDDFDDDMILTIKAETEFKDAATEFSVHNVEFTGDTANVEIKENASGSAVTDATGFGNAKAMSASFSTNDDTLNFAIKPKEGYTIAYGKKFDGGAATNGTAVVTVSYDKEYHLTTGTGATLETVSVTVSKEGEEKVLTDVASSTGIFKLSSNFMLGDESTGDDGWKEVVDAEEAAAKGYTEYAGSTYSNAPYSLKNIKINIETETETNQSGKITVSVADEGLSYSVVTGSGVEATEKENVYAVSEDASFVTLNITSPDGAPEVTYVDSDEYVTNATVVAGESGSYSVTIPVKQLYGAVTGVNSANSDIDSIITIAKALKNFAVKYDSNAGSDFDGEIKINKGAKKDYDEVTSDDLNHKQGDVVSVVLYAKPGTEFKTVKTETGTGASMQKADIALGEDKSEVSFELKMSDNVVVVVTTNDVYTASLSYKQGSTISPANKADDGVYDIPVGSKDITATLTTGALNTSVPIEYAKLYDGDAVAASKVSVSTNTAKIASIDEKDAGVLRLELTAKVKNKLQVVAVLQIRQEKIAEKMAIVKEWDGSEVTSLTLEPDSEEVTYKLVAKEGSLAFSDDTILLELTEDEAKVGKKATKNGPVYTVTDAKNNITAVYDTDARTLTIKAEPSVQGGYKGILRFYDNAKRTNKKIEDNICAVEGGTIAVETTAPSLKDATLAVEGLNHTNTTLRLQVSSDAKQPTGSNGNKVFYRVSFPTTDTFGAAQYKGDRYFLKTADSQVLNIRVNPETVTKNSKTEDFSDPKTFHPTVSLVQTTKGLSYTSDENHNVASLNKSTLIEKAADAIEAATKEARYEHTLELTPAKATVYTGAETAQVTKAVFSDNTGFANITKLEFVNTKTGVIKGSWNDASQNSSYSDLVATRKNDGSVYINASSAMYNKNNPDTYKDLGLKVTAVTGTDTMPASKVLPLTVVAGVGNIAFENGYQQSIYKQPGKAASLKVKAVLNYGKKEYAPKNKKFVYAMGDKNGNLPGEEHYNSPSYEITRYVKVDAKNGTVKVDKNFAVDTKVADNNKFSVVATEVYSGQSESVSITINDAAQSVGRIVIVDSVGNVVAENGVLKADDFYNSDGSTRMLYLRALTAEAEKTGRSYGPVTTSSGAWDTSSNYVPGVKYTSSAKSAIAVDSTNGRLTFLKAQKKPVKLSVAAADGSKSKAQSIEVTVQGYSAIALRISGQGATSSVNNYNDYAAPAVNYDGAMAAGFILRPMVKVNGNWVYVSPDYFKNLNIKIGKAKKIKLNDKPEYRWSIVKTDVASTVTVTDKTDKSVTATYTISQNPAATTKGPKIKSLTKLTQQMLDAARYAADSAQGVIPVRFQITGKDLSAYAGQYMMITPDYTKTKVLSKQIQWKECDRADSIFLNSANYKLIQIGGDGTFALPLNMYGKTNENVVPGNYTLIATVGSYEGGNFKPIAKGTAIKIKIPGKAPKALSLKLNGNFTLDESGSAVNLANGISSGRQWSLANTNVAGNYAMNKIDPETGKPNAFRKYFKVSYHDGAYWLGLQDGLTLAEIEGLRENSVDCEGYVTVATADQRQDMLIKVTIGDSVMGAVANDSYVGAETTVKFYASAKSTTPIKLKGVVLDATSEGNPSFATGTAINTLHVVKDGEDSVKVKLGAAEAGKSYKVAFRVLAADSAYANATGKGATINDAYVANYGRLVTATLKVVDPAKTKNAVTIEAEDTENGLAFTAYSTETYDAKKKTYSLNVVTKSNIAGADVSAAKIAETVKNKPFEGAGIVDIKKNKKDNCFILTLDKDKFVEKADGTTSGSFKRGKSVEVPVELTFANSSIASQTVNVKVTLPDPMDADRAVEAAKAAVTKMATFKVINMTNMLNQDNDGEEPKVTLQRWANDAWNHAIPYDTEAEVTRPISLTDGKGDNPTWEAELSIKADKKDKEPKWTQTLVYAKEEKIVQASTLVDAIESLSLVIVTDADGYIVAKGNKVDNDYTADKLREDIIKMLTGVKIPSNLSIVVDGFKLNKATVKANGRVRATIKVYDAVTKQTTGNKSVDVTFAKLGDLGVNADLIEKAIRDKIADSTNGKVDYQKVIYDALQDATGLETVEDALKTAIVEAAEAARTNSSVTVEFEEFELTTGNMSSYDNPVEVGNTIEVGFKLPDADENGCVKFTLIVKQPGMKEYTIDKTSGIDVTPTKVLVTGKPAVAVFQTITNVKTDSASWDSTNAILTAAFDAADATAKASFNDIDSDDDEEIRSRIKAAVETKITGVGLTVEVSKVAGFANSASGSCSTDISPNAEGPVYAMGKVTVSDALGREADWEFGYTVKIPAKTPTISSTEVTATKKVGTGEAENVTIAGNAMTVNEIGETQVITFSPKAVGNWLTDAQKKTFKYTLLDSASVSLEGNKTEDGGVVLSADGKLTVDPSKVTTGKDSTTGLTVKVKMEHNAKLNSEDTIPATASARTATITVTLKFKDATSAAAKLEEKTGGKYNWMPAAAITATVDAKSDNSGYELTSANKSTLATAVINATETYLRNNGYTGYTVAVKDDDYTVTAFNVTFALTVTKGDDTDDTNTITITAAKSPKTVANELMSAVKTAAGALNSNAGLKDEGDVASYGKDAAQALMDSALAAALDGGAITVKSVTAGTNKVTVTFTVTPSGSGSVESDSDTLDISITAPASSD